MKPHWYRKQWLIGSWAAHFFDFLIGSPALNGLSLEPLCVPIPGTLIPQLSEGTRVPETTASTAHTKLHSLSVFALVVIAILASAPSASAQTAGELAKARAEAQKLEKPLIKGGDAGFAKAEKAYKRIRNVLNTAIPRGPANGVEAGRLSEALKYRVYMLTNPKLELHELQAARTKFLKDLDKTGNLISSALQAKRHRGKVFGEVTKLCEELLSGNYYVRVQAIGILSSMKSGGDPYAGSMDVLLRIAKTSKFPELRLDAMTGLARLIRSGKLQKSDEMTIAAVMSDELLKPGLPNGTYFQLAEWLHSVTHTFAASGQPVAIVALLHSMNDEKRSWIARARAARALGATGDPKVTGITWPLIAWKIAQFGVDAAKEYKKQGGRNVANPMDAAAIMDIYLSLTPPNQRALDAGEGLRARSSDPIIGAAYEKIKPLAAGALGNGIDDKAIKALEDWVKANQPKDRSYSPNAPPLPAKAGKAEGQGEPPGNTQNEKGKAEKPGE